MGTKKKKKSGLPSGLVGLQNFSWGGFQRAKDLSPAGSSPLLRRGGGGDS